MSRRKVTTIPVSGGLPALRLVEVDGMLFSGGIHGADLETGTLSTDPEKQTKVAFGNAQALLQAAGLSATDIGFVTISTAERRNAALIDEPWRTAFPDAGASPARKVNHYPLPSGLQIELQVSGVVGQRPTPLRIGGLAERDSAPAGVRAGDVVFSSAIDGRDPASGELSANSDRQVRQAYANLGALLEDAGGSWDDVLHVYAFLDRLRAQSLMHGIWQEIFPIDGQCPARKAIHYGAFEDEATVLQLQMVAVLGQAKRRDFVLHDVPVHETGTMGAAIGKLLKSCGISGNPHGKLGSLDEQLEWIFPHARALMQEAGGSTDNIGHVTILVRNYDDVPRIAKSWRQTFPDPTDEPAHSWAAFGLNPSNAELVQFQITGVL